MKHCHVTYSGIFSGTKEPKESFRVNCSINWWCIVGVLLGDGMVIMAELVERLQSNAQVMIDC